MAKIHANKDCPSCGQSFRPTRSNHIYCSSNCRVDNFREAKEVPAPDPVSEQPSTEPLVKPAAPRSALAQALTRAARSSWPDPLDMPSPGPADPESNSVLARRLCLVGFALGMLLMAQCWARQGRRPLPPPLIIMLGLLVVVPTQLGYWLGEYLDSELSSDSASRAL